MNSVDPPLTVLLVEDNPNDARLIRRHLEGTTTAFLPDDIEVSHEQTLESGVRRLEERPVDLLLLDLGLGETDGAETFQQVYDRTSEIPVIVLTNLRDEQTAVDLLQQGAQDYINKGELNEEQLVKSIRYALERQEQKQRLKTTTEQLEVVTRILGHDVRNDVQVLQLWGERLLEEVPDEHAEDLERIVEASEHIQELTENTRAFMQVITGESDLETEPVRLDRMVTDELQKARSAYAEAVFEVAGELPTVTVSANEMLASVFRNLLTNAVRHNDHRPYVTVSLETADETARVTVTDDGPGVPEPRREEIFGKGEQGLDSEGTGIGLYLVYTLVTEFDGDVWVQDRADGSRGAAFVVELPAVETE